MTSCAANLPAISNNNFASVHVSSLTGACSAGKPCWCSWGAARKKSVILTRLSKLTRASSVGESIIGDTLIRVNGCLAVLNESPAEHFLFPYRTEPPTHWWLLHMTGSNQATRSSLATGVRTAISVLRVACITLRTTASSSWILTPGPTPKPSTARRVASRLSSVNTSAGKTTNTVWHTTCSRRGASHEACHLT